MVYVKGEPWLPEAVKLLVITGALIPFPWIAKVYGFSLLSLFAILIVAVLKPSADGSNVTWKVVLPEAAILFETGAYKSFDAIILVTADEDLRIQRVMERDKITADQVKERMKNQWADKEKKKLTEFVVSNNTNDLLVPQIENILAELEQKK